MSDRIVIIGGVACGPKAAARARRRNPDVEIVILERGEHVSYAGCGLPYYLGGTVVELAHLWTTQFNVPRDCAYFKAVKDIDVRLHTEATGIDRDGKRVHLRNVETGSEAELEYGQLVLATGASPALPPIEGVDRNRVFSLHVPEDAARMRKLIEAGQVDRTVIIGGGTIGLEVVESLFAHAVDVTIVEREDQLLPRLLDRDTATYVRNELARNDIEILTSEQAIRIDQGLKVVTDKNEIEADMILVAVGVRPNVALAQQAGLAIGETGAIAVNEHLQTSDPDIYAGGDCVESIHRVSGKTVYAPLGSTANKHGRVIGNNLTGEKETFPGIVGTAIVKSMGLNIARTGLTWAEAQELGLDAVATVTPSIASAHFYPGGKLIITTLVAERTSGKLLGAQVVGPGDVAKRIDVLATALTCSCTLKDISDLDLAYAPPYATAVDPVAHASNHTRNLIEGMARGMGAAELRPRLASEDVFLLLDVREPSEIEQGGIQDERVKCVPLAELRERGPGVSPDTEIVVVCQSGLRGYEACRMLEGKGFTNVKYLQGGVKAWVPRASG